MPDSYTILDIDLKSDFPDKFLTEKKLKILEEDFKPPKDFMWDINH
jgi:hypothetical protein